MKKRITAAVLAAVLTISMMTACGSEVSDTDSSKALDNSSLSDTSSQPDSSSDESSSSQADSSSQTSEETTTTSRSETTTTTTSASQTTSAKPVTTAKPAATSKPVIKTTVPATAADPSANNNVSVPQSGQWIGSVVVCDRNLGAKIRGLISFGGSESMAQYFCNMVNSVKSAVGSGVNVYTMGAPVSSAFYTPKNMSGVTTDQHKAITDLNKYLRNVKNIDTYAALAPHVNEYIYYRTDHHWTELAAYYAAEAFAKTAGVPFKPLSQYQAGVKQGFTGSMYTYSNCQEFLTYPDTYYYWKPKNSYTTTYYNGYFQNGQKSSLFLDWASGAGCYCTVLGSDMNLAEIKTDVKNGRTLVLIKDSYGNALVPYFVGSFEKIYVLDMRYTNVNLRSFFKQVGATDILFGSSLSSFYTSSRVDGIRAIL